MEREPIGEHERILGRIRDATTEAREIRGVSLRHISEEVARLAAAHDAEGLHTLADALTEWEIAGGSAPDVACALAADNLDSMASVADYFEASGDYNVALMQQWENGREVIPGPATAFVRDTLGFVPELRPGIDPQLN